MNREIKSQLYIGPDGVLMNLPQADVRDVELVVQPDEKTLTDDLITASSDNIVMEMSHKAGDSAKRSKMKAITQRMPRPTAAMKETSRQMAASSDKLSAASRNISRALGTLNASLSNLKKKYSILRIYLDRPSAT